MNYAGIIVNNTFVELDRIFTYKVPDKMKDSVHIGTRVKVPFGISNKSIDGFVVRIYDNIDNMKFKRGIKSILEICDEFPLFTEKNLELMEEMRNRYLCTYLECIKVFLPTGIIKGVKNKEQTLLYRGNNLTEKFLKYPYTEIYDILCRDDGKYTKNSLSKKYGLSLSSVNTMIKHGFIFTQKKIVERYDDSSYGTYSRRELNVEQVNAVNYILNSRSRIFLIHGVTGSGKTEIYMNLVDRAISENRESIVLVPEIALTPQMVERFKGRFGNNISVFHSRLSDGERYDEWMRVKKGQVKVAIGARSAIFLPFENLGFIIIDEEHEESYRSDSNPKYNAREVGEMICRQCGCKMVLGSATPSIETYSRCKSGNMELIEIKNRADNAFMPEVEIVDMRQELINNNKSIFSKELHELIHDRLKKREQIILFLNRRGFSTFVSCRKCGYIFKCNNCDISLTYHRDIKKLVCHYCGSRMNVPRVCPKCGSRYVKYFGVGTEKIEQSVKESFPEARVLRMDFDTTRFKHSYENIYNSFKEHKADILIGTQMVAKGLDFENVTLVGVIAADLSLNLPDFRSSERTYQLITQVSGRAGRGQKRGKVIIQTYSPDNYSIKFAADNDYIKFYEKEMSIRKKMEYPPFSSLLLINMSSKDENILIKNIQNVGIYLKKVFEKNDKIKVLGPCPCVISRIKEMFRWQLIIKGEIDLNIARNIKKTVYNLNKDISGDVKISIDLNPNNTL
ncbi:primosomal protein N' [Clostridium sp.]|uniref:primosomal protein N' n=1 Tax=Clostridium sp. TaxID=1506 RepID=UPI0025C57D15|nr:primosomal protein N' [Clostridium sp.]MCI1716244.1 primosomal protein N' [Clostridium sp.]MCI1800516.1 primosomal protein N' [Clostridium sp.]MCI1814421.1 primosomal protein N' [Clostridium sp.]MCI2201377.1 primosomal protein N' [Clostridium sp.]